MGCTMSGEKKITISQLKMHNSKESLWVKINNKIYDLTSFQNQHPGGAGTIIKVAGTDATEIFNKAGHSDSAKTLADKYCIGEFFEPQTIEEKMLMKLLMEKEKEVEQLKKRSGEEKSVYELLGGQKSIDAFIPIFYKHILADSRIKHYFQHIDMEKLKSRQNAYLSYIFGGPNPYFGKDMITAHKGMNLQEKDYNAVIENAAKTLTELGVSNEIIGKCATILAKDKEAVLRK